MSIHEKYPHAFLSQTYLDVLNHAEDKIVMVSQPSTIQWSTFYNWMHVYSID